MINKNRLSRRIKKHEGFSKKIYLDQLGNPTIGYGHLVRKKDKIIENKNYSKTFLIKIFKKDLNKAIKQYEKLFIKHKLSPKAEEVIVEMLFQLGINKFLKFKKMIKALKNKDYNKAAKEILSSKLHKQVPTRAKALSGLMKKAK